MTLQGLTRTQEVTLETLQEIPVKVREIRGFTSGQ